MPFAMNESTRFISPTKTLEYLAAGKPIVSTPVRDVVGMFGDVVRVAGDADGFLRACREVLAVDPSVQQTAAAAAQARARQHSWENAAATAHQALDEALRLRPVELPAAERPTRICRPRRSCRRSPAWAEPPVTDACAMRIDAHLHCSGAEQASDVLRTLDGADVDFAVLLAPFLSEGYSLDDAASLTRANDHVARLVRGHGDRLAGFAVVDPRDPGAASELRRAVETGLARREDGADRLVSVRPRRAAGLCRGTGLDIPILFHSGIFIDGRSGRFCRPSFFEALRDHPGLRSRWRISAGRGPTRRSRSA